MVETAKKASYEDNAAYLARAAAGDKGAEAHLMEANAGLVGGIAHRFLGRGVDYEDLCQIGSIGMLKAIRSFDVTRGNTFSTYAVPLIIGEIRRFLRDDGIVKVSRTQKRTGALLMREREKYLATHGVEPHLSVLAEAVGISAEEAAAALDAASPVHSLTDPIGDDDWSLEDVLPHAEDSIAKLLEHMALSEVIGTLPPLWRQILVLRYYKDCSQQQTADALGLTQVKISREEKKIFAYMRAALV